MRGKGQVSELDCRTAESMVNRYIDHTLNVDELEEFLDHVESCPSCYDDWRRTLSCMRSRSSLTSRRTAQSWISRTF